MALGKDIGLRNVHEDLSLQFGSNCDVAGFQIISTSNGNIVVAPNGSGDVNVTLTTGDMNVSGGNLVVTQPTVSTSVVVDRADGEPLALASGGSAGNFRYSTSGSFKIQSQPAADIRAGNSSNLTDVVVIDGDADSSSLVIDSNGVATFVKNTYWPDSKGPVMGDSQDYTIEWTDGTGAVHTIAAGDFVFTGGNVGLGVTDPAQRLVIGSQDGSDRITLFHNNADAKLQWDDGSLILKTAEGTNTETAVDIQGQGTGAAVLKIRSTSFAKLTNGGSEVEVLKGASLDYHLFVDASAGETPSLKVSGYRTGDAKRTLAMQVSSTVNDTFDFSGVGNYTFDGDVQILADNKKLGFGVGLTDLEIYSDGTDGQIDATTNLDIHPAGVTTIGDGGTTDYSEFETDGTLKFNGAATVWDDYVVPLGPNNWNGGSNNPSLTKLADDGSGSQGVYAFVFSDGDEAIVTLQMPHKWKLESTIQPHIHFMCTSDVSPSDNFGIEFEYWWGDIGEDFPATTTLETVDIATGVNSNLMHQVGGVTAAGISGTGHGLSSVLLCRIKRVAATGDNYAGGVAIMDFDIHYEIDTIGSRQEYVK